MHRNADLVGKSIKNISDFLGVNFQLMIPIYCPVRVEIIQVGPKVTCKSD